MQTTMSETRTCDFGGCGRPVVAHDLCEAHRKQLERNGKLKPLQERGVERVSLPGPRVSKAAAEAIARAARRKGQSLYVYLRNVIEREARQ